MKKLLMKVETVMGSRSSLSPLLLRVGLATVFLYAAISSVVYPSDWIGYLPGVLTEHFSATTLLKVFSIYELLLAAWLLSGIYIRCAALLCAATLSGIVVSNFSLFVISFRDIGLMFAALALAFSYKK